MTAGAALVQIMQQLRGIVAELNRRDESVVALKAQQALACASELGDELDTWELDDIDFAPVHSDSELAPGGERKGPRRA